MKRNGNLSNNLFKMCYENKTKNAERDQVSCAERNKITETITDNTETELHMAKV